jgi:hypothetical protein
MKFPHLWSLNADTLALPTNHTEDDDDTTHDIIVVPDNKKPKRPPRHEDFHIRERKRIMDLY